MVVAVTGIDGKPAFLTREVDGFAFLEIVATRVLINGATDPSELKYEEAGHESLQEAMEWYDKRRPVGRCVLYGYGFKVLRDGG